MTLLAPLFNFFFFRAIFRLEFLLYDISVNFREIILFVSVFFALFLFMPFLIVKTLCRFCLSNVYASGIETRYVGKP